MKTTIYKKLSLATKATALLFFSTFITTACSVNEKTAPAKPAAPVKAAEKAVTAPAPAKNVVTQQDVQNAFKQIQKANNPRYLVYDYKKINEQQLEYLKQNVQKMDLRTKNYAHIEVIHNAMCIPDKKYFDDSFKAWLAVPVSEGKLNLGTKESQTIGIVGRHLGPYNSKIEFDYAVGMFDRVKGKVEVFGVLPGMVYQTLRFYGDEKKAEGYFLMAKNAKFTFTGKDPKAEPRERENFAKRRLNSLTNMVAKFTEYKPALGAKCFDSIETELSDRQRGNAYVDFCKTAKGEKDRALFDKYFAKLKALPEFPEKFRMMCDAANIIGGIPGERIFAELEKQADTPAKKFYFYYANISYPGKFQYGFHEKGSYEKAKSNTLMMLALVSADKDSKEFSRHELARVLTDGENAAYNYGDYKFFEYLLDFHKYYDKNPKLQWNNRLANLLRQGKKAEALTLISEFEKAKEFNADEKTTLRLYKYFISGGTVADFDKNFADLKYDSVKKMESIRKVGAFFFRAKQFEMARTLNNDIMRLMFRPAEIDKHYTVKYWKNAPKTAEAWAKSPAYKDTAAMESRFSPYFGYDVHNDNLLLKDAKLPELKPEYWCGLQIVYDDAGVHIYLRMNDPNIEEVNLGKRRGGGLEWMFRPGDTHAYHSFYFDSLPGHDDPHYVNWAAPTKNYRLTYDIIFKDAVTTPEGYAVHVYIPWIGVYDRMPAKDNVWRLGLQVSNGDFRSLSGLVHEMARALQLDFAFTPEQRVAVERTICLQAFNYYNNIRKNDGGVIQNWNDYQLGDPEFYKASLEAYIADLDEAGKKLTAPAKDDEIHGIFVKYVPQWAEIKYILNDKRQEYLKEKMFK